MCHKSKARWKFHLGEFTVSHVQDRGRPVKEQLAMLRGAEGVAAEVTIRGCSHVMSAKNVGDPSSPPPLVSQKPEIGLPPFPLVRKNQKSGNPPFPPFQKSYFVTLHFNR